MSQESATLSQLEKPVSKGISKYLWSEDLNNFILALDTYSPTIPEAVVRHYVNKGGMSVLDNRVIRVIGLAADKFLADIVHDASQLNKLRQSVEPRSKKRKAEAAPITTHRLEPNDLQQSLASRKIHVKLPRMK